MVFAQGICRLRIFSRSLLERCTIEGDSPVGEKDESLFLGKSILGWNSWENLGANSS